MAFRKTDFPLKDTAYKSIGSLVKRFEEQIRSYKRTEYNETLARQDFINPFFKALGWDIDNSQGSAEAYREVMHEDRIKVGNVLKAPDYSFKLPGGKRLFFVEAKKPSVFVKEEVEPAYQIRSYAWSAKLPISILTDFEEFAVYDCNIKPRETDRANVARIRYVTYNEYLKEFDFLWDTFSKEKVLKGSFDKFIQSNSSKRGTSTVDKEFLISLDEWRKQLALNIALRNRHLNEEELNFVVQQTIDRIVFLRIAEDRSLEGYGKLNECIKEGDFYQNLFSYFRESDKKYNSGLFDFRKDQISKHVLVDNKTIKSIVSELYYPLSPYVFTVLNVEILGNAYEQFLGKQIKLTGGHRASIVEKPEVRKAGGVYYTPEHIVEYIVSGTIGPLVKDKTPKEIEKIKIADISCGSGSFLLGAYQYLLNWHLNYYTNRARKTDAKKMLTPDGNLSTYLKKKILTNNIYGVDIDPQAVEVTKLSLLLKCMEGETLSSVKQLSLFNERVLPNLDNNIKCGDSLIDIDYYDGQLDFGDAGTVKSFGFKKVFPEVFNQGGFDAVIGNPPWGADLSEINRKYLINKFPIVPTKTKDTYFYFLFKSINISKANAFIGLVLPNTWLLINNANAVRRRLLDLDLIEIIDHGDNVFKDAIVETSTMVFRNSKEVSPFCAVKKYKKDKIVIDQRIRKQLWRKDLLQRFALELDNFFDKLMTKVNKNSIPFGSKCEIIFGIKPYQVGYGKPAQTRDVVNKRIYHSITRKDVSWKPFLTGTDINRYFLHDPQNQFIKYGEWLMYKSNENKMLQPKIFLRRTSDTIRATYDEKKYYGQNSLFVITSDSINLKILLGILNSKLIDYIYKKKCPQKGKIFAEIKPSIIKELPIPKSLEKDNHRKSFVAEIIKNVDTLIHLNNQVSECKLETKKELLIQRIEYCEEGINKAIYKLYELTEDEVKVIEQNNNQNEGRATTQLMATRPKKPKKSIQDSRKGKIVNNRFSKLQRKNY